MGRQRSTRQSLRRIRTMVALLALALVASGCVTSTSFNGGGYLRSANLLAPSTEKATFGINGKCKDGQFNIAGVPVQGAGLYDGQFEYNDHAFTIDGVGVQFHGDVSPDTVDPAALVFNGMTCKELEQLLAGEVNGGSAPFQGTYRPQDKALARACGKDPATTDCTFTGIISDLGEPGVQAGDEFQINVQGGPFTGYTNFGPIQGNAQVD